MQGRLRVKKVIGKWKMRWVLLLLFMAFSAAVCAMCRNMEREAVAADARLAEEAEEQALRVNLYGSDRTEYRSEVF